MTKRKKNGNESSRRIHSKMNSELPHHDKEVSFTGELKL